MRIWANSHINIWHNPSPSPPLGGRLARLIFAWNCSWPSGAPFFRIFCPSKLHSNLSFEKMSQTSRKSMIWASQRLAKTHPKTTQNWFPQKNAVWHRCLFDLFCFFHLRFLKNIDFTHVKSLFLRISLKSCFCKLNAFSVQKPHKKPSKTKCETSKNRC